MSDLVSITWIETDLKSASSHPAFNYAVRNETGNTRTFLGDKYPEYKCRLEYPYKKGSGLSRAKSAQIKWVEMKLKHLRSFGIEGSVSS